MHVFNSTIRRREAEEDRVRLTSELANALERNAQLQEEKEMLRAHPEQARAAAGERRPNELQKFAKSFGNFGKKKLKEDLR